MYIQILPLRIQSLLTPNNEINTYSSSHVNDPHFQHFISYQIMSSFMHKASEFWYQLSPYIKDLITPNTFNPRIKKKHILSKLG